MITEFQGRALKFQEVSEDGVFVEAGYIPPVRIKFRYSVDG